jgi:hypothetical protein
VREDRIRDIGQDERVTVADAAVRLGITKEAVRKRISRRTLRSDKDQDGTVWVYIPPSSTASSTAAATFDRDELIAELRARIEDLRTDRDAWRDQARRSDYMASAAMDRTRELESRIRELAAPRDEREPSVSPAANDTPTEAPAEAQTATERPQQRSGWLAPVDKLPWWHYVLGISVVFLAMFILDALSNVMLRIRGPVLFAVLWTPPGIFGFWVGFRRRNLRLGSQIIPVGVLVAVVAALAARILGFIQFYYWDPVALFLGVGLIYVSGALLGNAWQRRRTRRISGTTPASPVSRTTQGAAQQHRRDLTPAQQAMLGWGGAIISALITLVGTIIAVRSGR